MTMRPALAALLALACVPRAHAASDGPRFQIPFQRFVLANGLTCILHPDRTLPQVALTMTYRVGSKDERAGRTGFAHLFEHLMFMGSRDAPYDLEHGAGMFDLLMELHGGENNADTSTDRTQYYEIGPPTLLDAFLWLEADRMATLADGIDQEKLDRQRRIVQNERRQSIENQPYGRVELIVPEEMYPAAHPYHHDPIGSHEDLLAATPQDVRGFFHQFYTPQNAILVLAGDFEPAAARALVERYFSWIPAGAKPPPAPGARLEARLPGEKVRTLSDQVELPRTHLIYHAPAAYAPGSAECTIVAAILGGGKSSRLERALRLERQMAKEVAAYCQDGQLGSLLEIVATARPGHALPELEGAIDTALADLAAQPPSATELERAVAVLETQVAERMERLLGRAELLSHYELYFRDPGRIDWDLARYRKLSPADVQAWAHRLFAARARLLLRVVPEGHQ
jgi:zinc protease